MSFPIGPLSNVIRLQYSAPDYVHDLLANLGRTEDVRFSAAGNRVAIACFSKNQVAVLDLATALADRNAAIAVSDAALISSPCLAEPHGVDFVGDDKLVVANRGGDATIFALPNGGGGNCYELDPIGVIRADDLMSSPGAVSVVRKGEDLYDALICNNYTNKVTSHLIHADGKVESSRLLLSKWLKFPDGISVGDGWIAVSNHESHNVLLYDSNAPVSESSDPDGILRYSCRPHGVRFAFGGNGILVADYEVPYVHVYMKDDGSDWRGVHRPITSLRVISDADFLRGPPHGKGPKGIDIRQQDNVLVMTCEVQPLAFFDISSVAETSLPQEANADQRAWQVKYELKLQDEVTQIKNSLSWRVTAPLRWLRSSLKSTVSRQ